MKTKKVYILISIVLITLLFMFESCNKEGKVKEPNKTDPIQGKLLLWNIFSDNKLLEEAVRAFKEIHTGLDIQVISVDAQNLSDTLAKTETANGQIPDIILFKEEDFDSYIKRYDNGAKDLSSEFSIYKDKLIKSKFQQCISSDGKILGVPWNITPMTMLYRKDYFIEAGIKWEDVKTWNDFIKAKEKINETFGGKVKMLPLIEERSEYFKRQLYNQLGIDFASKDSKIIKNNESKIADMEKKLADSNVIFKVQNENEYLNLIKAGEAAVLDIPSSFISKMEELFPEQSSLWGLMNIPAFEPGGKNASALDYSYFVVYSSTQNYKAASEFIKYCLQDKNLGHYSITERGIFPLYEDFYDDAILDKPSSYLGGQKVWRFLAEIVKEAPETK